MSKKDFLTEEFYADSSATLDVFNDFLKTKDVVEKDNYASGTFLCFVVRDTKDTRKKLSSLIFDFDDYQEWYHTRFTADEYKEGTIDLSGLQMLHQEYHDSLEEIRWCHTDERFIFKGMEYAD